MAPEKIEADGEGKETGRQTAGEERPAARGGGGGGVAVPVGIEEESTCWFVSFYRSAPRALAQPTNETFFHRWPLKLVPRVNYVKQQGFFCKNANDGRPEAVTALLLLAQMPMRCNGRKK